jgi:hypothetical protein
VRVRVSDRSISIQQDKRAEDLIEPSTVIIPPRLTNYPCPWMHGIY